MKKLIDFLLKAELFVAAAVLIALIACTFSGVFMRYIFSRPFTWEEEFQLACMVWITFLAAPYAFHTGSHVAIEILVDAFPKKLQKAVELLIIVLMYLILIYCFFRCIDFIKVIASTSRKTPILKIEYAKIYGIAPVSLILMLISYSYTAVTNLRSRFKEEKQCR